MDLQAAEERRTLIDVWFDMEASSEEEAKIMYAWAQVFEGYVLDKDGAKSAREHLDEFLASIEPKEIYSDALIKNQLLFAKIHEQLLGMGLSYNPEVRRNDRYAIKVAHILFPGDEKKSEREYAVNQVKKAFSKKTSGSHGMHHIGSNDEKEEEDNDRNTKTNQMQEAYMKSMMEMMNSMKDMIWEMKNNKETQRGTPRSNTASPSVPELMLTQQNEESLSRRRPSYTPEIMKNTSRNHIDVANRFKNKENKYGGSDSENLQEYLDQYFLIADDCGLSHTERLQYLHNLFKGEALNFYKNEIKGKETTIGGAVHRIQNHFNGVDKQQRIKAELSTLTLDSFTRKNHGNLREGLAELATYITNRTPQCPPNFRSEQNKIDFLRQAVIGNDWAKNVLCNIGPSTRFQQFYLELATALQVHEESARRKATPGSSSSNGLTTNKPFIMFNQPKYARQVTRKLFSGSEKDKSCWNCGQSGHRFAKCRKQLDITAIAARKAKFMEKKYGKHATKRTLYEMALGVSEIMDLDKEDEADVAHTYFGHMDEKEDIQSDSENESHTDEQQNAGTDEELDF